MNRIKEIDARRDTILAEMRSIRTMKKGSVTRQFQKVRHKGKTEPVLRGPYYAFTYKEGKKTVGHRLTTPEELEATNKDVEAHKRFVQLCKEFERFTEQLGELEREESAPEKKPPSSRSRKTRK